MESFPQQLKRRIRQILVVLGLTALPVICYSQKKASKDPEQQQLAQLRAESETAVSSGDLARAIELLTMSLSIQYDNKLLYRLGDLQLQIGDTVGYCRSYSTLKKDDKATGLYSAVCEHRDSLAFMDSGLDINLYPNIIAVSRTYDRSYGCTVHTLYDTAAHPAIVFSTIDRDTIYNKISEMPEFPEGEAALFKFLGQTIRYPSQALDRGISGTVYITFIIDKEGYIQKPMILRGVHHSLDQEALRVLSLLPQWKPGVYAGEPVNFRYNLPLRFTLR